MKNIGQKFYFFDIFFLYFDLTAWLLSVIFTIIFWKEDYLYDANLSHNPYSLPSSPLQAAIGRVSYVLHMIIIIPTCLLIKAPANVGAFFLRKRKKNGKRQGS